MCAWVCAVTTQRRKVKMPACLGLLLSCHHHMSHLSSYRRHATSISHRSIRYSIIYTQTETHLSMYTCMCHVQYLGDAGAGGGGAVAPVARGQGVLEPVRDDAGLDGLISEGACGD